MWGRFWKSVTAKVVVIVGVIGTVLAVGFHGVFSEPTNDALKYYFPGLFPWASAAGPAVVEKMPNSHYTMFVHQCESAEYEKPEFENLKKARESIEKALRDKGYRIGPGEPITHCDIYRLSVITYFEKELRVAKEAATALNGILSGGQADGTYEPPPATNPKNEEDKPKPNELAVLFFMPREPPKKK
jgi:hypothetical protein